MVNNNCSSRLAKNTWSVGGARGAAQMADRSVRGLHARAHVQTDAHQCPPGEQHNYYGRASLQHELPRRHRLRQHRGTRGCWHRRTVQNFVRGNRFLYGNRMWASSVSFSFQYTLLFIHWFIQFINCLLVKTKFKKKKNLCKNLQWECSSNLW